MESIDFYLFGLLYLSITFISIHKTSFYFFKRLKRLITITLLGAEKNECNNLILKILQILLSKSGGGICKIRWGYNCW